MTRLSSLVGGGGGPHYSDPRFLPVSRFSANILYEEKTFTNGSAASAFWTGGLFSVDRRGAQVDSNFSAGVAKQIVNITGAGLLAAVIGPTAAGAETTTFTIVVDGVSHSIAVTGASGARALMGYPMVARSSSTTDARFAQEIVSYEANSTPAFIVPGSPISGVIYLSDATDWRVGLPMVQFNTSLSISITHSENVTGTANQERRSGAYYRLRA